MNGIVLATIFQAKALFHFSQNYCSIFFGQQFRIQKFILLCNFLQNVLQVLRNKILKHLGNEVGFSLKNKQIKDTTFKYYLLKSQ